MLAIMFFCGPVIGGLGVRNINKTPQFADLAATYAKLRPPPLTVLFPIHAANATKSTLSAPSCVRCE